MKLNVGPGASTAAPGYARESLNAAGSVEVRADGSVWTTGGSLGDVIGYSITYPAAT